MGALERMLVGIDLSESSNALAEFVIDLAARHGIELVFSYVVDEAIVEHAGAGYDPNKVIEALVEQATSTLERLVSEARSRGVSARYAIYDKPADPAVALALLAEEEGASEIAVAHKGHKLFRIIPLGSTALGLVSHSEKPVLIVKPRREGDKVRARPREGAEPGDTLSRILVAVDKDVSEEMLSYLESLLRRAGDALEEVYVLHVIEPGEDEASAKRLVDSTVKRLQAVFPGVRSILLEGSKPYKEILAAASQLEATLLFVGRRIWKRRLAEILLGSTLKKIIEGCDIPVLVFPLEKPGGGYEE